MIYEIDAQLSLPNMPKIPETCHFFFNEESIQIYGLENPLLFYGNNSLSYLRQLIPLLDGTNTIDNILTHFRKVEHNHIIKILTFLFFKGIFEDYTGVNTEENEIKGHDAEYYSRSLNHTMANKNRFDVLNKIKEFKVLIFCHVKYVNTFIKKLKGASFENYELIKFDKSPDSLDESSYSNYQHILCVSDKQRNNFFTSLNDISIIKKISLTLSYTEENSAIIGPTIIPDETACYLCLNDRIKSNKFDDIEYFISRLDHLQQDEVNGFSHTNYNKNLFLSFLVSELVNIASFIHLPQTIGKEIVYNFAQMEIKKNDILRLPSCQVCSKKEKNTPYNLVRQYDHLYR